MRRSGRKKAGETGEPHIEPVEVATVVNAAMHVYLEEYKQTREEIRIGSKYVQDIANFAVLLFGGLAAYLASAWPTSNVAENNNLLPWMLLLAAILFLALVWLGFGEELFIRRMARFQETYLKPHIVHLAQDPEILGWEHWIRYTCPPGFFGLPERISFPADHWPRYFIALLPGVSSLLAYVLLRSTQTTRYSFCICTHIDWLISSQVALLILESFLYIITAIYVFSYQEPALPRNSR